MGAYNVYVFFWDDNTAIAAGKTPEDAVEAFFIEMCDTKEDADAEFRSIMDRQDKRPFAGIIELLPNLISTKRGKICWHI